MQEIELVVFDLAGTTVADRGEVSSAFTAALSEAGIAVTPEQLRAVRGASKREAIARLLPDEPRRSERAEQIYVSFRAHLERSFAGLGAGFLDENLLHVGNNLTKRGRC